MVDVGLNQAQSARQCVSFSLTAIASFDVTFVDNGYVHWGCANSAQKAESAAASAALLLSCLDASYSSSQSFATQATTSASVHPGICNDVVRYLPINCTKASQVAGIGRSSHSFTLPLTYYSLLVQPFDVIQIFAPHYDLRRLEAR